MNELVLDTGPASDIDRTTRAGFRLQRLEVMNWGTFDSRRGNVHVVPVDGETALLIGQNGSGKSTLVDALLTLLVRPGNTRNYNVAAGNALGEGRTAGAIQLPLLRHD